MLFADLVKLWNRFFFSEVSPLTVAAYRFLLGILVFNNFLLLLPDLYNFFGSRGWTSHDSVIAWTGMSGLTVFNFMPNNDTYLTGCIAVFMLAAASLSLGFKPRLCAFILFLGLNSLYHRDPFILNAGDTYMRNTMFFLIFAASGNAISLNRWLERRRAKKIAGSASPPSGLDFDNYKPVSIWPLRLLQLDLALVYCHTFYKKFWGAPWYDGTAVYFSSRVEDLQRFPLPFIFDHLWTIKFLTYSALALELSLFTLIWFKATRYYVIAAAVCFHLTIDYHMNIPFFEWLMIISYVLFIEPKDLAWVLRIARARLQGKAVSKVMLKEMEEKPLQT